ncbi:MAG: hypothetical protein D6762_05375 [Candidatus Neomarinimicrobiota bacterium]|nr:MAG: hypothetical protein D6762_05375 [Candidatus Neomarinimicrobiota bacterium]
MTGPKVGVALGSGSSRGWAHIGVLQALGDAGIPVHCVAGTSIGAYVGAIYAAGDLDRLAEFALSMDWKKVLSYMDLVFPKSGFIQGKRIRELLAINTAATDFRDLHLPTAVIATDLYTGERLEIRSGPLFPAIRASVSVPGVVTPVKVGSRWLVDGGLVDPVPVSAVRNLGADVVIAVDLTTTLVSKIHPREKPSDHHPEEISELISSEKRALIHRLLVQYGETSERLRRIFNQWVRREEKSPHLLDIMGSTVNIMQKQIAEMNLSASPPDVLIQPQLGDLKMFDFDQAERSIREGYDRTLEQVPRIKALLREETARPVRPTGDAVPAGTTPARPQ